jgi:TolB-like protein
VKLFEQLQRRGVLRVAISYAVIAWLLLQIGDVVLEPLDAPGWVMKALIVLVITGFPVSLLLAWFFELGPGGISVDHLPEGAQRPTVTGIRRYADVAIITVLLGVIVLLLARQGGLLKEEQGPPVIGVLPFTEQGVPEEEAYFGAGLADTLAYKLGQLRQILVLAPSSTREFVGGGQDLARIGALLGASALLEGTVRRAAGSLKVNARLVDIQSGQQLWSGSYDRAGADLFAVQDEIATAVTEALHLVLSPEDQGRVTQTLTESLSAYDLYLLGHSRLATRGSSKMHEAVEYFRQAVRADPAYALAHAGLAEALFLASVYYSQAPVAWSTDRVEAQAAAAQAQLLDPVGGEGYLAQAFVAMADNNSGDGTAWPREYIASLLRKAVELSPNNATALKFYSDYVDDEDESLAMLKRAAQLDPRSAIIHMNLGDNLGRRGDREAALGHYLTTLSVSGGEFALSQMVLPFILQFDWGRVDDAARWSRLLHQTHPNRENAIGFIRALLGLGAWEEAQGIVDRPLVDLPENDFVMLRQGMVLALAQNDCANVENKLARYEQKLAEIDAPDPSKLPQYVIMDPGKTAQALCRIRAGRMDDAHSLLAAAWPSLESLPVDSIAALALRTPVLLAAVYKAGGQAEDAQALLEGFLVAAAEVPATGMGGVGFSRFMALAVKGDSAAALAELESVAGMGWTADWWLLDALEFDPDYARVMGDPRFQKIRAGLGERVQQMRESYRANPNPPAEQLQRAGMQALE